MPREFVCARCKDKEEPCPDCRQDMEDYQDDMDYEFFREQQWNK